MTLRRLVLSTSYPSLEDDTAGHFVLAEVEEARARGEAVTVISAGGRAGRAGSTHFLGGGALFRSPGALSRLQSTPYLLLLLPLLALRFVRLARHLPAFDEVDAHWLVPFGWPGLRWVRGRGTVVVHGTDVRVVSRLPRRMRVWILRDLKRHGVCLRFVSGALRQELLACTKWPSDLSRYIGAASIRAAAVGLPVGLDRSTARHALQVGEEDTLIVVCGRLIASKRTDTALSAGSLVTDANMVVIGDGPERSALEARFPEARFLGELQRERALMWLAAADLLLHASLLEGAPTVVREARLLGTPVVATPSGDIERWSEGDPDLWCAGGSPNQPLTITRQVAE